jgi:hypothetical protein
MQIFRQFKRHAKYASVLIFILLPCTAFAASSTSNQSIEKQPKPTIKSRLQNKSHHQKQHLKTTALPPIKPAPRMLEVIPQDPNSTEPRRIFDIAPIHPNQDLSQNPTPAPTSTTAQ